MPGEGRVLLDSFGGTPSITLQATGFRALRTARHRCSIAHVEYDPDVGRAIYDRPGRYLPLDERRNCQLSAARFANGSHSRLAYEDLGSGDCALMLFTGWCSSRQRWTEAAPLLARHHRVVSFEWRGHGESDPSPRDFGTDEMVADALAVADAAGISSFVPCAASHSGFVAIELRRRFPERIPALVHADWMVDEPPERYMQVIEQMTSPDGWRQGRDMLFDIWQAGVQLAPVDDAIQVMRAQDADMWMRSARAILSGYQRNGSPLVAWSR